MSRAKAQVSLEAEASVPKVAKTRVRTKAEHIMVVVAFDCVATYKTWMIGNPEGAERTDEISPMLNKRAIENAMVKMPLMNIAVIMLRGTTLAEFWTSSPVGDLSKGFDGKLAAETYSCD